jgi:flagellar assembly protein FliH
MDCSPLPTDRRHPLSTTGLPMPYSEHQVIRAGATAPLEALATPDLPRGEVAQSELARTVLGEIAETARAEAHAQGYAMGWAQGRREAQRIADQTAQEVEAARVETELRRQAEHGAAVAALAQAADQVRGLLEDLAARIEEQTTDLAWALTETIMEREVAVAPAADVVRRVLAVMPQVGTAVVRVPAALAADPALAELSEAGLQVVPDQNLGPADALVEANGAVTDLRITSAMERVKAVLL